MDLPFLDKFVTVLDKAKLKDKTKKDYKTSLSTLCHLVGKDIDWILVNCEKTYDKIKNKNLRTQKTFITAILALFKHTHDLKKTHRRSYDCWFQKFSTIKKSASELPTSVSKLQWKQIVKKRKTLDVTSNEYFVLSLYTYLPPTLDFRNVKLFTNDPPDDIDSLNIQKTSMMLTIKRKTYEIPERLDRTIRNNILKHPRKFLVVSQRTHEPYENTHAFTVYLERLLSSIFEKKITLRDIRSAYVCK